VCNLELPDIDTDSDLPSASVLTGADGQGFRG